MNALQCWSYEIGSTDHHDRHSATRTAVIEQAQVSVCNAKSAIEPTAVFKINESSSTAPSYKTGILNTHTPAHVQNRQHEQTISSTDLVSIMDRASCISHRARIEKPSSVNLLELFCDHVLDRDKQAAKVKLELFENGLFNR